MEVHHSSGNVFDDLGLPDADKLLAESEAKAMHRIKLPDEVQVWLRTIKSTERIIVLYDGRDECFYFQRRDGQPLAAYEVDGTEDFFGRRQV